MYFVPSGFSPKRLVCTNFISPKKPFGRFYYTGPLLLFPARNGPFCSNWFSSFGRRAHSKNTLSAGCAEKVYSFLFLQKAEAVYARMASFMLFT